MAFDPLRDVDMPDQYPANDVADHEVFLSFRNDDDAIFFREWWNDVGVKAFAKWLDKRPVHEE